MALSSSQGRWYCWGWGRDASGGSSHGGSSDASLVRRLNRSRPKKKGAVPQMRLALLPTGSRVLSDLVLTPRAQRSLPPGTWTGGHRSNSIVRPCGGFCQPRNSFAFSVASGRGLGLVPRPTGGCGDARGSPPNKRLQLTPHRSAQSRRSTVLAADLL